MDGPRKRNTATGLKPPPTYEEELTAWLTGAGAIYQWDLTDVQIQRIVERAAAFAVRRGMKSEPK